jgi:FlaA1/EpsC-like NDP-sugar epimerase
MNPKPEHPGQSHTITAIRAVLRRGRWQQLIIWIAIDVLIILIAYAVAYSTRALITPINIQNAGFSVLGASIYVIVLLMQGVYKRIWRRTSGRGAVTILKATITATALIFAIDMLFFPRPMPISVLLLGGILVSGGMIVVRYRSRLIEGLYWRWRVLSGNGKTRQRERILIVGAGLSGQNIAIRLQEPDNVRQYEIIGFVDDDLDKAGMYVEGCRVLGQTANIPEIITRQAIDLIIMAIHNIDGPGLRRIIEICELTPARIKIVPDTMGQIRAPYHAVLRDIRLEDLIGRSVVTRHQAIDLEVVAKRVVLITGAAGSIGSELSRQMAEYQPQNLILLDNNESALHDLSVEIHTLFPQIKVTAVLVDITLQRDLRAVFEQYRPQIVFHVAAYKHVPMLEYYPQQAVRVNIGGTYQTAALAHEFQAERFVLISTDKAVQPTNVMGATKRIGELIVHTFATQSRTRFSAVRFGNVIGSRGSVIPTFERQITNGGPVTVTHKDMTRYFMSISEAANLVIHAAALTRGGDIFILKMGEKVLVVDIAERLIRMRGLRPYVDIPIAFTGIRPGEKLHEELFDGAEKPQPTQHPHILRLHESGQYPVSQQYLDQIRELIAQHPANVIKSLADLQPYMTFSTPRQEPKLVS